MEQESSDLILIGADNVVDLDSAMLPRRFQGLVRSSRKGK